MSMYTIIEESGFDRKFYFDDGTSHVRLLTKIAMNMKAGLHWKVP